MLGRTPAPYTARPNSAAPAALGLACNALFSVPCYARTPTPISATPASAPASTPAAAAAAAAATPPPPPPPPPPPHVWYSPRDAFQHGEHHAFVSK